MPIFILISSRLEFLTRLLKSPDLPDVIKRDLVKPVSQDTSRYYIRCDVQGPRTDNGPNVNVEIPGTPLRQRTGSQQQEVNASPALFGL